MYRAFMSLARIMAVLGGLVLSVLIVLTCISIAGRSLNGIFHSDLLQSLLPGLSSWMVAHVGPLNGDFELVEAGVAFAIFAFIPLCQITSGHASVDVFSNLLPRRFMRVMRALTEILFAVVLVLIAERLFDGMLSKRSNHELTFLLQFPVWWAYAASCVAALAAALTGVYMAAVRTLEAATGRIYIDDGAEADH